MTELTSGPSRAFNRGGQDMAASAVLTSRVLPITLALLWVIAVLAWQWDTHQPDFLALYFAATAYRTGNYAEIYAASELIFDGVVSPYWSQLAFETGFSGVWTFPYVYPPLWAALLAPVSEAVSLTTFGRLGLLFQAPLIPLSMVLAHRLTGAQQSLALWMGISLAMVLGSIVGLLAIMQNQPQIFVAFLILLAFERQKAGHPLAAGAALALAAAIKLYPAVLVLFWIVRGDRAPAVWFAAVGAILGVASLALAGIDLHLVFLERVRNLSDIVLGVPTATGLDTLFYQMSNASEIAQIFSASRASADAPDSQGFLALQPGWSGPVIYLVLASSLAFVLRWWARQEDDASLAIALPVALIVISICAPLSWYYHILPAFLMAPILTERLSFRNGFLVLVGFCLMTNSEVHRTLSTLPLDFLITPIIGIMAYLMLIAAFWAARKPSMR